MNRTGLTLMEPLIVVACSLGMLAACDSSTGPSENEILASMKSDLLRLVPAQAAFLADNQDYAGTTTPGPQVNGIAGSDGRVHLMPSPGNYVMLTYIDSARWRAVVVNAAVNMTCGIFIGESTVYSPNPAVTQEGVPDCWASPSPGPLPAALESMKEDLYRLVSAQDVFFVDNHDYAGGITTGPQVNGIGGAGLIHFVPSRGNVLTLTYYDSAGWTAQVTNPVAVVTNPVAEITCFIFIGSAPHPAPGMHLEGIDYCRS